ncbi:MAG: Sec-independent protein translocase protein TatB [Gammaproteobacteria bacterium]
MFDVSFTELALVGIVALLVVGPQKLPGLARSAGVWIGKTRRMIASVKAEVDRELKTDELRKLLTEQQAEVQELRQILDENRSAVEADIKQLSSELNATTELAAGTSSAGNISSPASLSPAVNPAPQTGDLFPNPPGQPLPQSGLDEADGRAK